MALFRLHRNLLEDSLKTCIEVNTLADLHLAIQEDFAMFGECIDKNSIKIEPCEFDKRIDWDTYIVTFSFIEKLKLGKLHEPRSYVAGFCNATIPMEQINNET